jgi:hypothetical protein
VRRAFSAFATYAAFAALAACDANTPVAILPLTQMDAGVPGFCDGTQPLVIVGDGITVGEDNTGSDDVCVGNIASRTFRFALCTCGTYRNSNPLLTDSFSSGAGPYSAATAGTSGSFGANGDVQIGGNVNVRGSVWAGDAASTINKPFVVSGDFMETGDISGVGSLDVGSDATILGNLQLGGGVRVAGDLVMPPGSTVTVPDPQPAPMSGTPEVKDPCACGGNDLVDIAEFIDRNRNLGSPALAKNALAGFPSTTLHLPCGVYYVDTIDGQPGASLDIVADGRVVLFVGGAINMKQGKLNITLGDDKLASIDLFVGGLLESDSDITFGDQKRPSKSRLYIGSSGQITLSGNINIAGNVYAPLASLVVSADVTVFGSLFVSDVTQSGTFRLHYDTDVLAVENGCSTANGACRTCADCNGQACQNNMCGECQVDADCCAPKTCDTATHVCVDP